MTHTKAPPPQAEAPSPQPQAKAKGKPPPPNFLRLQAAEPIPEQRAAQEKAPNTPAPNTPPSNLPMATGMSDLAILQAGEEYACLLRERRLKQLRAPLPAKAAPKMLQQQPPAMRPPATATPKQQQQQPPAISPPATAPPNQQQQQQPPAMSPSELVVKAPPVKAPPDCPPQASKAPPALPYNSQPPGDCPSAPPGGRGSMILDCGMWAWLDSAGRLINGAGQRIDQYGRLTKARGAPGKGYTRRQQEQLQRVADDADRQMREQSQRIRDLEATVARTPPPRAAGASSSQDIRTQYDSHQRWG